MVRWVFSLSLLLAACSPFESFYATLDVPYTVSDHTSNCRQIEVNIPKDVMIRKPFISPQILAPSAGRYRFEVRLDDPVDLKRRMLLNVAQGPKRIRSLKVWANGQQVQTFLASSALLNSDVPDMVVDLCANLHQGSNTLEVEVQGEEGASATLFLDGFMLPIDIPEALHSATSFFFGGARRNVIHLKFLEGMKVRLQENHPVADQLHDLTKMSLYPLRLFMQTYDIKSINGVFSNTPEEQDQLEQRLQADGSEVANRNLMYDIRFDEKDERTFVRMVDILEGMPFFESIDIESPSDAIIPASLH